jgi:hypothetical protein
MDIQELFNTAFTQFPMSVKFTPRDTAPAQLYITASAFSTAPNQMIGVNVALDDKPLGSMVIFANEAQSHKALVTTLFSVQFADLNPHTLTFTAATPYTKCDKNDIFGAALLMISEVEPFVWNTAGPIPQYTTFHSQVSGAALLFFSGSAFRSGPGPVGVEVVIAGKPVAISQYQASTSSSHQAFPPRFTQVMLPYSKDPIPIGFSTNSADVSSDFNDRYQIVLIY